MVASQDEQGKNLPFELIFVVNHNDDKQIVLTFDKKQAKELLKEIKHAVSVVDCFS